MRRCLIIGLFMVAIGFLIRYSLVMYYTFCNPDPWGVERYLSMRGVEDARIDGCWRLNFSRCHDPSSLIGAFPMFTSICGRCDEFDVSKVVNCNNLDILNVGWACLLRNLESLKGRSVFQVTGTVDSPIVDTNLLNTIQNSSWLITLRPTTNSFHDACTCLLPEIYDGLLVDADVFSRATCDEIDSLRGQAFSGINWCSAEGFWEMFDVGYFYDWRRAKKIPVATLLKWTDK